MGFSRSATDLQTADLTVYAQNQIRVMTSILSYIARHFDLKQTRAVSIHTSHSMIAVRGPDELMKRLEAEAIDVVLMELPREREMKKPRVRRRENGLDVVIYGWMPAPKLADEIVADAILR